MSPAMDTHTRFPSGVTLSYALHVHRPDMRALRQDAQLRSACDGALAANRAMMALMQSVAALAPADPRHATAYAALDLLRPDWRRALDRACALAPATRGGLLAKSALLASLVERDEMDAVVGGPVAQLAASLADDLLAGPDPDADHRP